MNICEVDIALCQCLYSYKYHLTMHICIVYTDTTHTCVCVCIYMLIYLYFEIELSCGFCILSAPVLFPEAERDHSYLPWWLPLSRTWVSVCLCMEVFFSLPGISSSLPSGELRSFWDFTFPKSSHQPIKTRISWEILRHHYTRLLRAYQLKASWPQWQPVLMRVPFIDFSSFSFSFSLLPHFCLLEYLLNKLRAFRSCLRNSFRWA